MFFSLYYAFKIARSRQLTMREFLFFTLSATVILPLSVWGVAWSQWVALKSAGDLTLWKIGLLKISILWKHFVPLHMFLSASKYDTLYLECSIFFLLDVNTCIVLSATKIALVHVLHHS